jgi:subtilisin family serine protease
LLSADSAVGAVRQPRIQREPLTAIALSDLMSLTQGRPSIAIGLIDGPVAFDHSDLSSTNIREVAGYPGGRCADATSAACEHGTFVAGILCATRGSQAPAICPGCILLVRPIFSETTSSSEQMPSATPAELAGAIFDVIEAGARVINLSAAMVQPTSAGEAELGRSLDHCARKGIIVVAAAGNQGVLGSSVITRHAWVIPVVAYGSDGHVLPLSNLGTSIGQRGIGAPGEHVTSLRAGGGTVTLGGTSVAAPFVTGTIALLWSCFPDASAAEIKLAVSGGSLRRRAIVPPLVDAKQAYRTLEMHRRRGLA